MNFFEIFKSSAVDALVGDPFKLVILLFVSTALGFIIAWTYKKTHRGFSYSQSFSMAVVLVTVITTLIIVLIEDNIARAIGIFGAFSIIRFRTAVKDVRDIAFIFFSLAVGLAVGVGTISYALVGTLVISGLIFFLHKTNFGGLRKLEYVLNFKFDVTVGSTDAFKPILSRYLKSRILLNVEAKQRGDVLAYTFNVKFKDDDKLSDFVADLTTLSAVSDVNVVSSKNDLEV